MGERQGTALTWSGEGRREGGRVFLELLAKGRYKEGSALALGLGGTGGAVRMPVRGFPMQYARGVSREKGGLPQSKPWREGGSWEGLAGEA